MDGWVGKGNGYLMTYGTAYRKIKYLRGVDILYCLIFLDSGCPKSRQPNTGFVQNLDAQESRFQHFYSVQNPNAQKLEASLHCSIYKTIIFLYIK